MLSNRFILSSSGQSTIEFAIVTLALLFIVIACGAIWRLSDEGLLIEHTLSNASHHLSEAAAGVIGDVFSC